MFALLLVIIAILTIYVFSPLGYVIWKLLDEEEARKRRTAAFEARPRPCFLCCEVLCEGTSVCDACAQKHPWAAMS